MMGAQGGAALAGPHRNELLLFYVLLELTIIVLAGRLAGAIARRYGQSAAVGEIIVGILLGPSLFGWIAPQAFDAVFHSAPPDALTVLSSLGLVLLMFQVGTEFDFAHLTERSNRAAVLRVSIACLALPGSRSAGSCRPRRRPEEHSSTRRCSSRRHSPSRRFRSSGASCSSSTCRAHGSA
jgi:hypothetical protein